MTTTAEHLRAAADYARNKGGYGGTATDLEMWAALEDEREHADVRLGEKIVRWLDGSISDVKIVRLAALGSAVRVWIAEER